jgi:hypothetical protein
VCPLFILLHIYFDWLLPPAVVTGDPNKIFNKEVRSKIDTVDIGEELPYLQIFTADL